MTDTEVSTAETALETPESSDVDTTTAEDENGADSEPETFPAEYVRQLRQEAADARVRAKDRDALAERLHVELVRATGRLADPTDLPFDADHLEDVENMERAIDALLEAKPHLASRKPAGDIGQGATPSAEPVDLAAILRANAS